MKALRELLKSNNLIIMGSHEYPIDKSRIAFWGGMGVVAKEISERLVKHDFNVLVLPRKIKGYASTKPFFQEQNGVYVLALPIRRYQASKENTDLYNYYPVPDGIISLDHCYTTWRHLQKMGIGNPIIHGHDWMSVAWIREAKRAKLRNVFTVHLSAKRTATAILNDKRLELERLAGSYAEKIHYVSVAQMRDCSNYGWNHNKKHNVIPNGVDINKYIPPKETPLEDYILYVGRLAPVKNVVPLILGWSEFNKKYPDVKLKILGASGVSNLDVQKTVASLTNEQKAKVELRIEMVSEAERIKYYQGSSVCCFPSSREAFGIVAIEAQACHKPVVVGNVGGFKENVLEGVTGLHVNGTSPEQIAEALRLAYENRTAWGRNARKLVITFYDWDKIVKDYIRELYTTFI